MLLHATKQCQDVGDEKQDAKESSEKTNADLAVLLFCIQVKSIMLLGLKIKYCRFAGTKAKQALQNTMVAELMSNATIFKTLHPAYIFRTFPQVIIY